MLSVAEVSVALIWLVDISMWTPTLSMLMWRVTNFRNSRLLFGLMPCLLGIVPIAPDLDLRARVKQEGAENYSSVLGVSFYLFC